MIAAQGLLVAIFVSGSFAAIISDVETLRQSCPKGAVVDLTQEMRESSGSVNKSGEVFPRESIWTENNKTFGCPCEFKRCKEICCPLENAFNKDNCIKDEVHLLELFPEKYHHNSDNLLYLFIDEPCSRNFYLIERYNKILESRFNIWKYFQSNDHEFMEHCPNLERIIIQSLGIYFEGGRLNSLEWCIVCVNISMIFVLATFIVYSVIPKLKNLQGSILRCYLASYICCIILFTIYLFRISSESALNRNINCVIVFGFCYFGITCMMWLNVMNFHIWRTFRKFRPSMGMQKSFDVTKRQKKTFFRYSIYAWCGPLVFVILLIIACVAITTLSALASNWQGLPILLQLLAFSPIVLAALIAICNTMLYISTALAIKERKKETAHVVGSLNKHHKENEQWFNLYGKLFVVMGCPLVLWSAALLLHNEIFWKIIYLIEALQGISIFYILVWKDDVKGFIRNLFDGMLHGLHRSPLPSVSSSEVGN